MKRQVLFGALLVGMLTVSPLSAGTSKFSTDPDLSNKWTEAVYYEWQNTGLPNITASWNEDEQNLDLLTGEGGVKLLYRNNTTRSDSVGVTVTFSNFMDSGTTEWEVAGLLISSVQSPSLFDSNPLYGFIFQKDSDATPSYYYKVNKNSNNQLFRLDIEGQPYTIKMDIIRDGSDYVFLVNDAEIFRDSTYATTSLPYYSVFWGAGYSSFSLQADNFGTITTLCDANSDNAVNELDATVLAANWLSSGADCFMGDFNDDGIVDDIDATLLATNWQGNGSNAVPEPSAIISAVIGLIFILPYGSRKRK